MTTFAHTDSATSLGQQYTVPARCLSAPNFRPPSTDHSGSSLILKHSQYIFTYVHVRSKTPYWCIRERDKTSYQTVGEWDFLRFAASRPGNTPPLAIHPSWGYNQSSSSSVVTRPYTTHSLATRPVFSLSTLSFHPARSLTTGIPAHDLFAVYYQP